MWWEILLLIISLAISVGITYGVVHETDSGTFVASMAATIFYLFAFLLLVDILGGNKKTPSAKDVYRGQTTLEITYKIKDGDTINVDTVVVYKDEFKEKE